MPNDKYYNKVVWDNQTLIDLTGDTVTAADLRSGVTAHGANGQLLTGTLDMSNYVTLNTVQTITAEKTFEAGLWASSSFNHTSITPNNVSVYSNYSRVGVIANRHIASFTSEGLYIYTEGSTSTALSKIDRTDASFGTALNMLGTDINLMTTGSSSNDSSDIVWRYGNGQEKARIWTDNLPTTNTGLNYRAYDSDGLQLANGKIITSGTTSSITFEGVTAPIKFKGAYATINMIKFKDGPDQHGSGLILGGGGLTVIGGGESADVIASTRSGGTEELHLASDSAVALWTNVQNGESSAKKFLFNTSGDLEAPRYVTGAYFRETCGVENGQFSVTSNIMFANSDNYLRKTSWSNMVAQLRGAFVSLRAGTTLVSSDSRVIIDEGSYMVIGTNPGSGTAQGICVLTMRVHASADTSSRIYFCNQMPTPIAPVGIIPISYTTGKTANAGWYYIGTNGRGISNTGTIYKNEAHCISVAYVTALF